MHEWIKKASKQNELSVKKLQNTKLIKSVNKSE